MLATLNQHRRALVIGLLFLFGGALPVSAHVKWFTDFSFLDQPQTLSEAISPLLIGLTISAALAMTALVYVDQRLEKLPLYERISDWLESHQENGTLILRIGLGATLLLSWQNDTLLAPYLEIGALWGWLQFVLVLLLLLPQTTPLAGAGTLILWLYGVFEFGPFYMLDYISFLGIAIWLMLSQVERKPIRELGIPALYFTVGFALLWLAMEKIIYPDWGIDILQENPQLALGLPFDFFLTAAAFVEITLGYLLLIGLLGRPLGLVITLVFFTTTLIFGKVEVIGHTHIHTALLIFLIYGPGDFYPAPIDIHRRISWRMAFAAVNFVVIFVLFLAVYSWGATSRYEAEIEEVITVQRVDECQALVAENGTDDPDERIMIDVEGDSIPCNAILDYAERG